MSTKVTASMVKTLREMTGAPMMDCKKALQDEAVLGDVDKAVDWLRAKGMAKATKNADREAKEGLISIMMGDGKITLVEVNSETDFVGRNKDFQSFVAGVVSTAHKELGMGELSVEELLTKPMEGGQAVDDALIDVVNGIRENISIKRALSLDTSTAGTHAGAYVHGRVGMDTDLPGSVQMGSSAAVVILSGGPGGTVGGEMEVCKRLAMHAVASKPTYAAIADVPADVVERETEVGRQQMEEDGAAAKKPEIVERIIAGKVNKRLGEICLLEQNHVAEEGAPKVGKFLSTAGFKLVTFSLWNLGSK